MTQLGTGLAILLVAVALVLGGIIGYIAQPDAKVITVDKPVLTTKEIVVGNLTEIDSRVKAIEKTVTQDDKWEVEAKTLATSEWSKSKNKDLFNALNLPALLNNTIVDREDIQSVVIKTEKVTSSDAEDKDAVVIQELKVRYEDKNGVEKKVYVDVETTIDDGEIDDQDITLA